MDEEKLNFEVIHNVISDKHVKGSVKYAYNPERVQSPIPNLIVYDIGTYYIIKCGAYVDCINKKFL